MNRIDPVLYLLLFGMVLFTAILLFVDFKKPSDSEIFQVIATVLAGFSGAFFTRLDPHRSATPPSGVSGLDTTSAKLAQSSSAMVSDKKD